MWATRSVFYICYLTRNEYLKSLIGRRTRMEFGVNITCNDECIAFEDNGQFRAENRLHR